MNNPRSGHTHCQATQAYTKTKAWQRVCLPNRKDEKETTKAQHCIKAIAGKVVKSKPVHLINFCGGGQVIALKSATALILDRWSTLPTEPFSIKTRIFDKRPLI